MQDELVEYNVALEALEGTLTLSYRPGAHGLYCHRFEVTLGPMKADVEARVAADPAQLAESLRELLASPTLTGEIKLFGVEHDVEEISIRIARGKGTVTIRVTPDFAADGSADLRLSIDQSGLHNTLQDLQRTLRLHSEA